MSRAAALYARQSVEKTDSISIETQLAACRREAGDAVCREYLDRGFSGGTAQRPAFQQLLHDIAQGEIGRVIVYKLDRISRSIVDFASMIALFDRYQVDFVSTTERFDTGSPIGRAMLHICIVFAQLERETIQKRVMDAYYARCRRGFYMGGRTPYGFSRCETVIDGIHTAMYQPIEAECAQIRQIFAWYASGAYSLRALARKLTGEGIPQLRTGRWNAARLSDLLCSPVYVRTDPQVYAYLVQEGAVVHDPPELFTAGQACYLYRAPGERPARHSLAGREVVLAPHEGIVDGAVWLACRMRCAANIGHRPAGGNRSWLTGLVRCAHCGYALVLRTGKTRAGRYFVCGHVGDGCRGTGSTLYAGRLEEAVERMIADRLIRWGGVEQFAAASQEKTPHKGTRIRAKRLPDAARRWEACDDQTRQACAKVLIDRIEIADGEGVLFWRG